MRGLITFVLAAFALAPVPAFAQQAAWAQDRREAMCVFDGLMAPETAAAPTAERAGTIRSECMQRFGWTPEQATRGFLVAHVMIDLLSARGQAINAGADEAAMDRVYASFSDADGRSLGVPGDPVTPESRLVILQLSRRVADQGLTGDIAQKAGRAILLRMMANNIVAAFVREVQ
jgi:hypothetical protein